jgi:hypothetical protein
VAGAVGNYFAPGKIKACPFKPFGEMISYPIRPRLGSVFSAEYKTMLAIHNPQCLFSPGRGYPDKRVPPVNVFFFIFYKSHTDKINHNFEGSCSSHVSVIFCLLAADAGHKGKGVSLFDFVHTHRHKKVNLQVAIKIHLVKCERIRGIWRSFGNEPGGRGIIVY